MQLATTNTLLPFNPADRPGVPKGKVSTVLSALDKSGVVYKKAKLKDSLPAVSQPVSDLPGLAKPAAVDSATKAARIEQQARQLISQTFFGTMLKQMRDSPFKSDLFEGGHGGQAFSGLYDQKLIEHMSRGAGKKLVDAVVRKFDAKHAYAKQSEASKSRAKAKPRSVSTGGEGFGALNASTGFVPDPAVVKALEMLEQQKEQVRAPTAAH